MRSRTALFLSMSRRVHIVLLVTGDDLVGPTGSFRMLLDHVLLRSAAPKRPPYRRNSTQALSSVLRLATVFSERTILGRSCDDPFTLRQRWPRPRLYVAAILSARTWRSTRYSRPALPLINRPVDERAIGFGSRVSSTHLLQYVQSGLDLGTVCKDGIGAFKHSVASKRFHELFTRHVTTHQPECPSVPDDRSAPEFGYIRDEDIYA
ncbi:hypothetical protein EXIGLDRAFT_155718 [Exidia glandulosa HHB12029]|uniref:Uncharacterized protein n=1 Tax=Exidia glandulosa HHB12029 TaxID=1314781 RepID=A0A165QIY1_EXIGL|nr:hypothetical protein EXIGLDRAFT_155718 [Exidia glandulosa HHB12029]